MVGGTKSKIKIRIAWTCGDLPFEHCDSFGILPPVGELLCPCKPERDRLPRAPHSREQPNVPDHSPKFGSSLSRRSQFGKAPADERARSRRIELCQHPILPRTTAYTAIGHRRNETHRY